MEHPLDIPPCPHCKTAGAGVMRSQQVSGWIDLYYFSNRQNDHQTNQDNLTYGRYKPIRCCKCFLIRRDIEVIEDGNSEIVIQRQDGR